MNILIIIDKNPFFQSSASANRWRTLIEGLVQFGVKFKLLIYEGYTSTDEKNEVLNAGNTKSIEFNYLQSGLYDNIWKKRFYRYIGSHFKNYGIERQMINIVRSSNYSIVWTSRCYLGFKMAWKVKKILPNQTTFLEMSEFLDIHKINRGNFLQRLSANKRKRFFDKSAFYSYDGIALMTKTLFNHYKSFKPPNPKLLHLPMTVDFKRFEENSKLPEEFSQPYIVFVGVMNNRKDGVDILINAFSKIADYYPGLSLYLIGPWHYDTPGHLRLIDELHLNDRIFYKGEYARDTIPAILNNAQVLALPRPDSKQAQGGFPTKLGEYLATGNPVCATRVGEIPDYLADEKSVLFAEPGSVDSFANSLNRALANPQKAREIALNGKQVALNEFNKDIQAKKLYDFLNTL